MVFCSTSKSKCGAASSTWCPISVSRLPARSTASRESAQTGSPLKVLVISAIRIGLPRCWMALRKPIGGLRKKYGAPESGPEVTSRIAAVSRTLRLTRFSWVMPSLASARCGPAGLSPRLGLRPTRPLQAAGMRIDPPLSVAWAAGTMPLATAAAEPPLEPPAMRSSCQGLRVAP